MQTLTLKSPADIVAAAPIILGFVPQESVVMLTFGGNAFHARVDLPPEGEARLAIEALLPPCQTHGIQRVIFCMFAADRFVADAFGVRARRAFTDAGIEVMEVLHAHDGTVTAFPSGQTMSYDTSTSTVTCAAAVEHGTAPFATREALAATLDPVSADVRLAADTIREYAQVVSERGVQDLDRDWTHDTIQTALDNAIVLDDLTLASLIADLEEQELRDVALTMLTRENAQAAVNFWSDAVRRAPEEYVARPAALLGVAAWLRGDGALAWIAVDRAHASDPDNSLADLVADVLGRAVPPTMWDGFRASYFDN